MHVTYNGVTFADVPAIAALSYEDWITASADYWKGKKGRDADLKRVWELSIELLNYHNAKSEVV